MGSPSSVPAVPEHWLVTAAWPEHPREAGSLTLPSLAKAQAFLLLTRLGIWFALTQGISASFVYLCAARIPWAADRAICVTRAVGGAPHPSRAQRPGRLVGTLVDNGQLGRQAG